MYVLREREKVKTSVHKKAREEQNKVEENAKSHKGKE